jgi:hypothetical protein
LQRALEGLEAEGKVVETVDDDMDRILEERLQGAEMRNRRRGRGRGERDISGIENSGIEDMDATEVSLVEGDWTGADESGA